MHLVVGIVLFILIGLDIALVAYCAYGASLLFEGTGGFVPHRGFKTRKHWEDRSHAWYLMSVIGFLVVVFDVLVILWGVRSTSFHMALLLGGGFLWVISASVAEDCAKQARRTR